MTTTFQAIAVLLLALLPGALYTWAFERIAGRWGIGLSDRLYRFVGISAIFHVCIAPASYAVWRDLLRADAGRLDSLPLWLWFAGIAYVAFPGGLGVVVGTAYVREKRWATVLVGTMAAPRAWDAVFSTPPTGAAVLMRLKSGAWVGGEFNDGSYAAGYPEPADIYLVRELHVDQQTGDFVRDASGDEIPVGKYGLLVRWDEVEYLEIGD